MPFENEIAPNDMAIKMIVEVNPETGIPKTKYQNKKYPAIKREIAKINPPKIKLKKSGVLLNEKIALTAVFILFLNVYVDWLVLPFTMLRGCCLKPVLSVFFC